MSLLKLTVTFILSLSLSLFAEEPLPEISGWGVLFNSQHEITWESKAGTFSLTAPGPVHDLSIEIKRMNAPFVLQHKTGDFDITVRVDGEFSPGEKTLQVRTPYHGAGILLMADPYNYMRLERATLTNSSGQRHYANYEFRVNGKLQRFGKVTDFPLKPGLSTWFKVSRKGNEFITAIKQPGGDWVPLPNRSVSYPPNLNVGVAAVNVSTKSLTANFSEFQLTP